MRVVCRWLNEIGKRDCTELYCTVAHKHTYTTIGCRVRVRVRVRMRGVASNYTQLTHALLKR